MSAVKVRFAWRAAVGDAVDRASRVTLRDDGALCVQAVDQHWRREIERSSPVIVERLQALLGEARCTRLTVEAPVEQRAPRRRATGARPRRSGTKRR